MDLLKVAVIILFVILTVFTVKFPPQMHQAMIIEDADFKLVRISDTLENIPVAKTPVKVAPKENNSRNINLDTQQQQVKYIQTETPQSQPKQVNVKPVKYDNDTSQLELLQRIIKNTEQQPESVQKPVQKPVAEPANKPQQRVQPPPKQTTNKNPYMTEQEEIIAWNKWRSNIQNQIMKDSNIDYAPLGTMFMFTFMVDKFGNVSNIKVECSHPDYMDIARKNVKPAIASLQRKPILNFPRGTQRTSTVVTGVFLIGTQDRYSTPNDFADFERVTF